MTSVSGTPAAAGWSAASQHLARLAGRSLAALALACVATAALAQIDIHMAPNGNDANDGKSPATAVATLKRAMDMAVSAPKGATVLVAPGVYVGQRATVALRKPVGPITLTAQQRDGGAIFDGGSMESSWLRITSDESREVPITIQNLTVRKYGTAIAVDGPRGRKDSVAGVRIQGNRLEDIGTGPGKEPSTAAIRLVSVTDSAITDNVFRRVRNARSCELLHPIYMAHGSSRNLVERNVFDDNCGVAIKVRDGSSENRIRDNLFLRQTLAYFVQDWYCDSTKRKDCRDTAECPSWNTEFSGNRSAAGPVGPQVLDIRHGERPNASCEVPAVRSRFRQ